MNIKAFIPNFVTLLNLLCGSIAVIFVVNNHFMLAAIFVFLGIFFDFFDGLLARKLKVQSDLGIQLDSLADMITSGLVPGLIMYKLLELATNTNGVSVTEDWSDSMYWSGVNVSVLPFLGLLITLSSAYRLARFNIDEDQQTYFKGLPTPANALLILSLPLILEFQHNDLINATILNPWFLVILTLISTYLLNSPIKLFALKFKDYSFKNNGIRYIFLILSVVMLIVLQFAAIPIIILLYIILSLISK
ncbi:MAG: CDP-alcohol phosphatidyltransferase family protein [Flavobacteriaceae bacterium]|nr:CDP-alcohol phosphatidyltransferase family protein [Flavobacteriaceae bacterium]